jgi:putative spermidine/putrescine transport system permease protein
MHTENVQTLASPLRPLPERSVRTPWIPAQWVRVELLILPALAFLLVFYAYPLFKLFLVSIDAPSFSARHYIHFVQDSVYLRVLIRTFAVSALVTVSCLGLGFPVAYVLARVKPGLRAMLLIVVVVPYLTSFLVRSYAWIVLLDENGVLNSILVSAGIIDKPVRLVYNSFGVYVGMVQVMLPFMILPLYNVMTGIDQRLIRAAHSMGAGPARTFLQVFLPLCGPGIKSGCLLVFLLSLGFYVTPAVLGGLSDVMLSMLIETQIMQLVNWGFGAAAAMVLLLTTLAGYFLLGKTSSSGSFLSFHEGPAKSTSQKASKGREKPLGTGTPLISKIAGWLDALPLGGVFSTTTRSIATLMFVLLVLPSLLVVVISFSSADVLRFPPPGWSLRWYESYFTDESWIEATELSIRLAVITTVVSAVLGTLASIALVRGTPALRATLSGLLLSPMIVPPIVIGVAMYQPLANWGLIGQETAVVIGHVIGALPYLVIIVTAALGNLNPTYERAAASMGAGPVRTFLKLTFPLIRPSVLAGSLFAFIHSFDELVITMLVGGALMQTLPLKMWSDIKNSIDPTIAAVSAILIGAVLLWLVLLHLIYRGRRQNA